MFRRLALVLCATALTLAVACGRQVTPNPPGVDNPGSGLTPGFMQVKFRTAAPMDFTNVRYWIAFNTSCTGTSPYPKYCNQPNNYRDCYFEFVVGGNGVNASPQLFQIVRQQGPNNTVVPIQQSLQFAPQDVIFTPNTNGQNTEFTLTFRRQLFNGITFGSPAPQPTATTQAQNTWYMNFFTSDTAGNTLDSSGTGGAGDIQFFFSVDTSQNQDNQFTVPAGAVQAPSGASQIASGEVINNP